MLRLNHPLLLLFTCVAYFSGNAQTNGCSAKFSYTIGSNNTVRFIATDTLNIKQRWLFGDGTSAVISIENSQTHQFYQAGTYQVKHYVENPVTNCKDSSVQTITVTENEKCAAVFYFLREGNDSLSMRFYNSSITTTGIKKISWNFGDGQTSSDVAPVHLFAKPGIYNVCLSIETNSGCSSQYCRQVGIIDSVGTCVVAASFQYKNDPVTCNRVYFSNTTSPAMGLQYAWSFGDGTTSHESNPVHDYTKAGRYRVCLVVETGNNCRKEFCDSVTVVCNPCAGALYYTYRNDSLNCRKIIFANNSTVATTKNHFIWNFGDGSTSNDVNPTHIYAKTGAYRVCLVSESDSNCRKEFCDTIVTRCSDSCTLQPSFAWKANSNATNTISFTSVVTSASNLTYSWNFGDSSAISHDANPMHIFSKPGTYNVCLLVKANETCERQVCMMITIVASCNTKARFEKHREASQPNTVYFSNVSQPLTNIWQTYWTYGDSSSSRDFNSFHTYAKPGVYTVCLKVIGLDGCSNTYCDTVTVQQKDSCKATAGFAHYNVAGTPLATRYEALYNNSTAVYTWTFGDGSSGSGRMPTHQYSKVGSYNICLLVKDGNCGSTHCDTIAIENTGNGRIALSPNPALNTVALEVKLDKADRLSIRFMDASGGIRSTFTRDGNIGNNRFVLPVDRLSQGIYLVEIKSYNGAWYSRFVKG